MQSFLYENHCKCYKKVESRLRPVLFTVIYFPLKYASGLFKFFSVVLGEIHGKVDICQNDYSIHSKLRIFLCSVVMHESTIVKPTKGQTEMINY